MDIENATTFGDQGGIDVEIFLQFRGQTGRFGKVVSHGAVCDGDLHGLILGSRVKKTRLVRKGLRP